mgnify:CR=1 FL=1
MPKQQLLLLKDVEGLGRAGDLVQNVRPGYRRNFLFPQKLAVLADARALKLRERIQEQRRQQAIVDKRDAEAIATKLQGVILSHAVKVDHEGHMYGSVAAGDLVELVVREYQITLERRNIALKHPIKATGVHEIHLKLKEGVSATFTLKVLSEEDHKLAHT